VEGTVDLDLPGVRLSALGEAVLVAEWMTRAAEGEGDAARRGSGLRRNGSRPAAPGADASDGAVAREGDRAVNDEDDRPEEAQAPAPPPRSTVSVTLGPQSTVEIKAAVSDLKEAAGLSPLLADALKEDRAAGEAEGRLVLSLRRDGLQATGDVDLTGTTLNLGRLMQKPAGQVLRGKVSGDVAPHPRGWIDVRLAPAEVRLGDSATSLAGRIRLDWTALTAGVDTATVAAAAISEADVKAEGDWRHGPDLDRTLPWLASLRERCGLDGATRWTLTVDGSPIRGRVDFDLDATDCRVSTVAARGGQGEALTVKPAGTPASVRLMMQYGEVPGEMRIEDAHIHLAESTATASGRLLFDNPRLLVAERPTAWTLRVDGRVPDAALLASLLPWRMADLEPTGAVTVNLRAAADVKGAEVESCRLRFDAARIRWLDRDVGLNGTVAYDHESLETDGLDVKVGGSDVRIVMYIARPNEDPTGSLIVRGRRLDVAEVLEMIRKTSESLHQEGAEDGDDAEASGGGEPDGIGARIGRLLARAHLSADVRLDSVSVVNPKWDSRYDLEGFEAEGRLAEKHLVLPRFACRLNQGTVTGRVRLDFRESPPLLDVAYDARDLQVEENLKPFINTTFPGMQVFGTLSTQATRMQRLASGTVPVGGGETVLTDGLLEGPSAPDYVIAILPGLKLTRYEFNRMSNVFEQHPDGVTDNRMLFDGKAYDLFIFGKTHPDGTTRYTMGVDLLLSLGSEVSRTLDQGKLPLMHYNGRIVDKAFAERDISYVLPHELAYDVFLRRNLLLRLIRSLGRPEPDIRKPDVVPPEERRPESGLAEPREDAASP
jgi:hypothetical protein